MGRERIDSYLDTISSDGFEYLVAEIWQQLGYETEVTQGSHDRGVDVIAKKDIPVTETILIQAKYYSGGNTVGSSQIQQYSALKHQNEGADRVILVTTSSFTAPAIDLAEELGVDLIDRADLISLIEDAEIEISSESSSGTSKGRTKHQSQADESIKAIEEELSGTCSACGASDVVTATCAACGEDYCTDCRKPFQHGCRDEPKTHQGDRVGTNGDAGEYTIDESAEMQSGGGGLKDLTANAGDADSNPLRTQAKVATLVPMWVGLVIGLASDIRVAVVSIPVGLLTGYVWAAVHDVEYSDLWF
ncbi:restriction endonuclease [Halosimplex halophilum]|uniref:restriction endonuclease n=1 Tax=Halosimplex halophilum TaxID=2559572 RepID=UPI0014354511|nr:restriction endonuclease [Halosimplex halophilum]